MDTSQGDSQDPTDDGQDSGTDEDQSVNANANANRARPRSPSGSSEDESLAQAQPAAKRQKTATGVPSRKSGTKKLPKKAGGKKGRAAAGGRRAPCRRKNSPPRRRRASPRRATTGRNTRRACAGRGARRRSPARRRRARSPSSDSSYCSSSCSSRGSSRTSFSSRSRSGSRNRGRSLSSDSQFDIPLFVPKTIQDFRFDTYIRRMQKKTNPKLGMQCDSVRLMDNFLKDVLHMITLMAASRHMGRRKTLQPKIMQKALKKILPRGMWERADEFGMDAVDRYCTNKHR